MSKRLKDQHSSYRYMSNFDYICHYMGCEQYVILKDQGLILILEQELTSFCVSKKIKFNELEIEELKKQLSIFIFKHS